MMINPVFRRENRTALRTWKTFYALSFYVLVLTCVAGLYVFMMYSRFDQGFNPQSITQLYQFMTGFQLGLILLIVPPLTGGAISGERERQTLDLMLVTKMSTLTIVLGKLFSSLLVVILMIVASIPVFGIILYYGGVSIFNLFSMALFYLVIALMVGSFSILLSSIYKKTVISIILNYFVIGFVSLGSIAGVTIVNQIMLSANNYQGEGLPYLTKYYILMFNPFMGFLSILDAQNGTSMINDVLSIYNYNQFVKTIDTPMWVFNVLINLGLAIVCILLSSFFIRPVRGLKKKSQ